MRHLPMIFNMLDPGEARARFAAQNAQQPAVWNLAADGGVASLHIYGAIGGFWGDVDAAQIVPAIRGLDVATLEVFINSPGGDVWDGIAIRNALRQSPANVITHVDGLAASAASLIATAGDEVVMGDNSQLMIHDAWMIMIGNADEMRESAELLDRVSQNIAGMYAAKAGGEPDAWRALMKAETWYGADEAVTAGLADRVGVQIPVAAEFDLSMFAYAGRAAAMAPIPAAAMAAPRKETRMNRAQLLAALNAGIITQDVYDAELARLDGAQPAALAPALATPGEPIAAEYAAGPQGTVTPAANVTQRPVTLNSLMPELVDAARRTDVAGFVSTINNALDAVIPANDAGEGFLTAQRVGELWQASPAGRPVIDSLGGTRPLTGTRLEGFRWVLPTPAPEPYVGNATEVPSDPWTTEAVSEPAKRWAKANRVDRIFTDLGSPDLISSLFQILDRNYEQVSDSDVLATVKDYADPVAGATSVLDALITMHLTLKRIGATPSKFWLAEDLFGDFAALKISDLPAWIANSTGYLKLDGEISLANVFDADVNFELLPGEILTYDSRAATVFESPKIHIEAQAVGFGAIDIGWFAYGGALVNDTRAALLATAVPVTPPAALSTPSKSKS